MDFGKGGSFFSMAGFLKGCLLAATVPSRTLPSVLPDCWLNLVTQGSNRNAGTTKASEEIPESNPGATAWPVALRTKLDPFLGGNV
jgi:hypothetical protein